MSRRSGPAVEDGIVRARRSHAQAVPGLLDAQARVVSEHHEVGQPRPAVLAIDAGEDDEVLQDGRERGERLPAVEHPAVQVPHGHGIRKPAPGRRAQALLGRNRVHQLAAFDGAAGHAFDPLRRVGGRFALLPEGLEVHHERQGCRTVAVGDGFQHTQVLTEGGFAAAEPLRHGQAKEAGLAQLLEVLERKRTGAVMLSRTLGKA